MRGSPTAGNERIYGSPAERFWAKVDKSGNCWVWTAARNRKGYGSFAIRAGESMLSHRFAWKETNGEIPEGMSVLHRCDNPPCVNPSHLFLGDQLANVHDALAKGRFMTERRLIAVHRGANHYARMHPERIARGEARNSKLTEKDVRLIRLRVANGESPNLLAAEFGVSYANIWSITRRKTWTHI